jgi:hypothetical protein
MTISDIGPGMRVTILVPSGLRIDRATNKIVMDYVERTGRAVMRSSHGGWVLNMGGPHGTSGLADKTNIMAINGKRLMGTGPIPEMEH